MNCDARTRRLQSHCATIGSSGDDSQSGFATVEMFFFFFLSYVGFQQGVRNP